MPHDGSTRREFLKGSLAGVLAAGMPSSRWAVATTSTQTAPTSQPVSGDALPRRALGKTGERISILGLGGDHVGRMENEPEAVRLVHRAIDSGITFLDTAWTYGGGRAETRYGQALAGGYRDKVFLMTKAIGRTKADAMQQLDESLRRLRTDHVDLWQLHAINRREDPERIFAPGGAVEALDQARKQGKVRYVGFTGHREPQCLLDMLRHDFAWDTVQMPINVLDPHYKSFGESVLPILVQRGIGAIAMKTLCWGWLLRTGLVTARQALAYAWSQPVSLVVCGMDRVEHLAANVAAAKAFQPMSPAEQARLLAATRELGRDGRHEPHKTAQGF